MFSELKHLRRLNREGIIVACKEYKVIKEEVIKLEEEFSKTVYKEITEGEERQYINLNSEMECLIESIVISLGYLKANLSSRKGDIELTKEVYSVLGEEGCQVIEEVGFEVYRVYVESDNHYIKYVKHNTLVEGDKIIKVSVNKGEEVGGYECKFGISSKQDIKDSTLDLDKIYREISDKISKMTVEEVDSLNRALKKANSGV